MKRQFVWIMTDTTRYDMLGCYGNPDMVTPHLDALADQGLRFDRAYTTQPVCGPARSALFSGQFPHSNASWGNSMPYGADIEHIGQRLSARGIPCAYIGKWHLDAGDYFGNGICPDGWDPDYWYDMKCYLDELTPEERLRSRNPQTNFENGGITAEFTYGHRCADRALDYLDRHAKEDFFLTVSFDEPHDPYLCPEPYASMYLDKPWPKTPAHYDTLEAKPLYQQLWGARNRVLDRESTDPTNALLLGCNSFIDSEIGRIIDRVHAIAPDALIMFTSDHGDAMQGHCLAGKGATTYDEISRIPLIFEGKACAEHTVYPGTVSHIDLPATVLDYMGVEVPQCFEGKSLVPFIADPQAVAHEDEAFVEFGRYEIDHDGFGGFQPMRAIVTNRYKLELHLLDEDLLFDCQEDPYELHNLIHDPAYAEIRNALHDRILAWMNDTRDPFRGYQWQCRPWRTDLVPNWEVDGYTRQRKPEPGGYRQLDYATGLPMTETVRKK